MTATQLPTTPTTTATTRTLLTCGAVAAPLWTVVSLTQAATRDGFDLTRHPLSMLSNGSLGWLQITNFILAGVLVLAGAAGLRHVLHQSPGGTWIPRLTRVIGLGMIGAGVFVMDPADGFPAGTPTGVPTTFSWQFIAHNVASSMAFAAIIATCYVLGHHFGHTGRRTHAVASRVAGTALLVGLGWAMSGGTAGSLTLAVGFITAMLWISKVAHQHRDNR